MEPAAWIHTALEAAMSVASIALLATTAIVLRSLATLRRARRRA